MEQQRQTAPSQATEQSSQLCRSPLSVCADCAPVRLEPNLVEAVLLGVAVGDALGLPVEGCSAEEVRSRYGRLDAFQPIQGVEYFPGNHPPGTISDDTELTLSVMSAISGYGLDLDALARSLVSAYDRAACETPAEPHPCGWGWSVGDAVLRMKAGIHWSAAGRTEEPNRGLGNGVIIKLAPVALELHRLGRGIAGEDLIGQAEARFLVDLTCMTHASQLACAGSLAYAAALLYCLRVEAEEFSSAALLETALLHADLGERLFYDPAPEVRLSPRLHTLLNLVRDGCVPEALSAGLPCNGSPSRVDNSLPLTLGCFACRADSPEALIDAVNAGGDTDSNGSMVGALLGCLHGDPAMFSQLGRGLHCRERITGARRDFCDR